MYWSAEPVVRCLLAAQLCTSGKGPLFSTKDKPNTISTLVKSMQKKNDPSFKSQVDSVQKQNELAMHNMQCMGLCGSMCLGGQLPSNLYDWNAAPATNQLTTSSAPSTTAVPAGVSCQEHLADLCESCWALRSGSIQAKNDTSEQFLSLKLVFRFKVNLTAR